MAGLFISCEWGACAGAQVVKKFPEVTACSIEERLKENMAKLERDWKIKGPAAANVVKRQPQARHTGQRALWVCLCLLILLCWIRCMANSEACRIPVL